MICSTFDEKAVYLGVTSYYYHGQSTLKNLGDRCSDDLRCSHRLCPILSGRIWSKASNLLPTWKKAGLDSIYVPLRPSLGYCRRVA